MLSSTVFVLVLFIGFCVVVRLHQAEEDRRRPRTVVKSLDERITHQPMVYLAPTAPRGPADQLQSPELLEAAARK